MGVRFAFFEFVVVFCLGIIFNLCLFLCVYFVRPVCVSAPGVLQGYGSKLPPGAAEGGPLRLSRSASFFAGLCGMLSTVRPPHVSKSRAGS